MPSLEYPVTRQYPWRWTTLTVCFCAGFALVALGLLNFAAVGYNSQSAYYDEFKASTGVEWKNKLNVGYTQDSSVHCDPSNIVLGGTYRTNNAIFALNVESLRDPLTSAPLGSANYSGDVLDSCRVNRIYMMAEYSTHEVKYRAQVACRNPSLFVNFTVDSVATIRAGVPNGIVNVDTLGRIDNEQSRPEAVATSVLYALGLDVLAAVFFSAPPVPSSSSVNNGTATSLWAEWDPLASNADLPIILTGMASADGAYIQTKNASAFEAQGVSIIARTALRNFAIALHSAILVDVGSTIGLDQGNNILTSLSALTSRVRTDELLGTFMTSTVGSANGLNLSIPVAPFLLSNPGDFRLPITARQVGDSNPARLVQRYLCHRLVLKSPAALVIDVMVATMSMFMVGWGITQIVLMYVAKEHTVNGNYCTCPACDTYNHARLPAPVSPKFVHTPGERDGSMAEYGTDFDLAVDRHRLRINAMGHGSKGSWCPFDLFALASDLDLHPLVMRLSLVFVVALGMGVLGQSTIESEIPTPTVDPSPPPETTIGPSSPLITSEIATTITSAPESSPTETTTPPIVSTAAPPSGGGATCVQRCLAQSADTVGCRGGADISLQRYDHTRTKHHAHPNFAIDRIHLTLANQHRISHKGDDSNARVYFGCGRIDIERCIFDYHFWLYDRSDWTSWGFCHWRSVGSHFWLGRRIE
ncbi:unnamed protein product [Rhizoctonia solani]|uniref:Uncharacterized protein n=1 Tax=Rhizoctonia solani TaxID=456999 RepID=A0A8H3CKE0_9AGAM|nr:unnamed protein product [Rhizoctonia solani]